MPAEVTLARLDHLRQAVPITRVADLTPLDRVGLPVFCAVTPLARDLTTHMGKGRTPAAAKASAVMEACERVSAEFLPEGTLTASYDDLIRDGQSVADPRACTLSPDTAFDPARELDWVPGVNLMSGAQVLLAADLVICPPQQGVLHQPDTNGLASGNNRLEAVVHGLCEVIERDAAGRLLFAELFGKAGDNLPGTGRITETPDLPPSIRTAVEDVRAQGLEVLLEDLTQDIAIPVCRAVLIDPAFPTPRGPARKRFAGLGCSPNAELALSRALTEAGQSRLAAIQGARDSFNTFPRRRASLPAKDRAWRALPHFISDDLLDDLDHILGALTRAGFEHAYAADLTRPDLDVAVMRVCVPGLSTFFVDQSRVSERDMRCLI